MERLFYTESEGGMWIAADVSKNKEEILEQLKTTANKGTAKLITAIGTVNVHSVLFPDNKIYYPLLDKIIYCDRLPHIPHYYSYVLGINAVRENEKETLIIKEKAIVLEELWKLLKEGKAEIIFKD